MNDKPNRPPKRTIIRPQLTRDDVTVLPSLSALLDDAKSIIGAELSHYRHKVKRGVTLDLKEARAVQGYMETLVKLSKEERENTRSEDLSSLSNEELLQLATELTRKKLPSNSADTALNQSADNSFKR
jgi:hypothetical protein